MASDALVLPCLRRRPLGTGQVSVGEGRAHAIVFEAARWVHALILEEQTAAELAVGQLSAGSMPTYLATWSALQKRLTFADRNYLFWLDERQQFV